MSKTVELLKYEMVLVYLNDVIDRLPDFDTHMNNQQKVFVAMGSAGLQLNAKKCTYVRQEVLYLILLTVSLWPPDSPKRFG